MGTATEKYKAFKQQYEAARKEMVEQSEAAFKEFAADIFQEYSKLENFAWTQYTPYFNDGEECTFGVNDYAESIYVNGKDGCDDDEDEDEDEDEIECVECHRVQSKEGARFCGGCGVLFPEKAPREGMTVNEAGEAAETIAKMLQQFDGDILKDLYGDHVRVTIYRDGRSDTQEYEHD